MKPALHTKPFKETYIADDIDPFDPQKMALEEAEQIKKFNPE